MENTTQDRNQESEQEQVQTVAVPQESQNSSHTSNEELAQRTDTMLRNGELVVEPVRIDSAVRGLGSARNVTENQEQGQNRPQASESNIVRSVARNAGEVLIATFAGGFVGGTIGAPLFGATTACAGSTCEKVIKAATNTNWRQRVEAPAQQEMQR